MMRRAWLAVALVVSCAAPVQPEIAAPPPKISPPPKTDRPLWVLDNDGATLEDGKRVVYAVVAAAAIKHPALAKSSADTRARGAVLSYAEEFAGAVLLRHMRALGDDAPGGGLGGIMKGCSAESAGKIEVVDYWTSPEKIVFARARIDLASTEVAYVRLAREAGLPGDPTPFFAAAFDELARHTPPARSPSLPCAAWIRVYQGSGNGDCDMDPSVVDILGILSYACEGGEADAVFGDTHVRGTVSEEGVDLLYARPADRRQSCRRTHSTRITGKLASGVLQVVDTQEGDPELFADTCGQPCSVSGEAQLEPFP